MKKQIALILAALLLQGTVVSFAEEDSTQQEILSSVTMTVEEATEYALAHSLLLAAANAKYTAARYSKTDAAHTEEAYREAEMVASSIDIGLITTGYYYRTAVRQTEIAKRNFQTQTNALKIQVQNDFYTYLNKKNKTALAEQNLLSAQEKAGYAKARLENGMITQNDCLRFELAAVAAQNAVNAAKRQEEIALRTLKDTMNFPQEKELLVNGTFVYTEQEYKTPEEAITLSRTQNTYLNLCDAKIIAEERWKFAEEYYFTGQPGYTIEKMNYEASEAEFLQNVQKLDTGIYTTYHNLMSAKENIDYLRQNVELLKVDTEATYLRYEMGMLTANDYFDAQQRLFSMQNDLMDAELAYYIGVRNYSAMYSES